MKKPIKTFCESHKTFCETHKTFCETYKTFCETYKTFCETHKTFCETHKTFCETRKTFLSVSSCITFERNYNSFAWNPFLFGECCIIDEERSNNLVEYPFTKG